MVAKGSKVIINSIFLNQRVLHSAVIWNIKTVQLRELRLRRGVFGVEFSERCLNKISSRKWSYVYGGLQSCTSPTHRNVLKYFFLQMPMARSSIFFFYLCLLSVAYRTIFAVPLCMHARHSPRSL